MGIMISFILFIIMSCYALYINYSLCKYCDEMNDEWAKRCTEMNNEWAKKCCEINKKWADAYNSVIKEKENES